MDAALTQSEVIAVAIVVALSAGGISFLWPANVLRRSGWAIVCAVVGPFVVGFLISPFLGSGAGLGIVMIFAFLSAAIALGAVAAIAGAMSRRLWDAWRRAEN
jgi:hypothetical protein